MAEVPTKVSQGDRSVAGSCKAHSSQERVECIHPQAIHESICVCSETLGCDGCLRTILIESRGHLCGRRRKRFCVEVSSTPTQPNNPCWEPDISCPYPTTRPYASPSAVRSPSRLFFCRRRPAYDVATGSTAGTSTTTSGRNVSDGVAPHTTVSDTNTHPRTHPSGRTALPNSADYHDHIDASFSRPFTVGTR